MSSLVSAEDATNRCQDGTAPCGMVPMIPFSQVPFDCTGVKSWMKRSQSPVTGRYASPPAAVISGSGLTFITSSSSWGLMSASGKNFGIRLTFRDNG